MQKRSSSFTVIGLLFVVIGISLVDDNMYLKYGFLLLGMAKNNAVFAQKIDVDSLLNVAVKETYKDKNYESALKKTQLGIKLTPDYLDFHLLRGRIYQLTNVKDSARY